MVAATHTSRRRWIRRQRIPPRYIRLHRHRPTPIRSLCWKHTNPEHPLGKCKQSTKRTSQGRPPLTYKYTRRRPGANTTGYQTSQVLQPKNHVSEITRVLLPNNNSPDTKQTTRHKGRRTRNSGHNTPLRPRRTPHHRRRIHTAMAQPNQRVIIELRQHQKVFRRTIPSKHQKTTRTPRTHHSSPKR